VNGEATVFAVTCGFESGEASVSVGSSETKSTGILKGFGEIGFSAKGVDGGVELANLVFALAEADDVSRKSPVAQFVGSLS